MRKLLCTVLGLLCMYSQLLAQNRTLTGKVTDEAGNPIPNASIQVRGRQTGTTSGSDGSFSIAVADDIRTLVVSSVNYTTQEVPVGKNTAFVNPVLKSASGSLSEVVVVGYGTQRKSDVTASVTKVGGDKVANVPLTSVDQILQGKAAGLQSATFSGQPGANQQIRIRGIGSYTASSQPLFVIDGIQINSGDVGRLGTTSNVLANINPDDIESISVLKDAAATSIYGSRGSNGVIIITTKRGKAGKTQFNFTAELGQNRAGDIPDAGKPLRAADWLMLYKEGLVNAGYTQAQADQAAATYGDGSVDTDWFHLVTRVGKQRQYNLSASGGDEKTKFYVSGGYFNQESNVIGSALKRYSAIVNLDHNINKKLSFSLNLQPSYSRQNTPLSNGAYFSNPVMEIWFARPTINPYNADGTYNISNAARDWGSLYNPLYILQNDVRTLDNVSAYGKAEAKYNILDNLSFTSRMGLQYLNYEEFQYNNRFHGDGRAANGRAYAYNSRYFLYDWTNTLDYRANLTKSKDLTLNAKLGYEAISSKGYFVSAGAQNFPTSALTYAAIAATPTVASNSASEYTLASAFASTSFNYKGKYILAGNIRRDGSSRFSEKNQYGVFPSGSFAWNISKEKFFSDIQFVSDLKLRASYGAAGNAEIGNYAWRQAFGFGANYNGQPGGTFNTIGNENLQWESSKQADVGFDAAFLKNKLNVTVDYYNKVIDHLIFSRPTSMTIGFSSINENIGAMRNYGVELTVNARPVQTKDFAWDLSFNITRNKNEVTKLPPGQTQVINGQFIIKPGYDIYSFFMREWAGVDPQTGDPLWYADSSRKTTTNNYNAAARVITGKTATPKFYGGLSSTLTYKGLSLSADLYYNFGNYVQETWNFYFYDQASPSYGKYSINLNRWQKPGDITNVPKPVYNSANNASSASTRFLFKGDFIRLRNVTLGYTLPGSLAKALHISSLNAYVRGTNLWTKTFDDQLPFDPEQGVNSQQNLNIFYNRALTFGINAGF